MTSEVRELRRLVLGLEMRRNHARLYGALVPVGRGSLAVLVLVVIAAVEVGRSFVFVGAAVLRGHAMSARVASGGERRARARAWAILTYWYRVISSRMSPDEYS